MDIQNLLNGIDKNNYTENINKYKFILNYFELCNEQNKDNNQISIFSFHEIADNKLNQFQKEIYCLEDYDKVKMDKTEEEIIKFRIWKLQYI